MDQLVVRAEIADFPRLVDGGEGSLALLNTSLKILFENVSVKEKKMILHALPRER